jgi:peptidoglycan hydrolase-like protein with peptidoglycan-binding domain
LFDLGFLKAKPDGLFGKDTEAGTRAFQTAANSAAKKSGKTLLTVDGIVGPATIARAAEARIMTSGPAAFTGDEAFGDDSAPFYAPSSPRPDSPLEGWIPPMMPTPPDPRRALASRLLHMLVQAPRGGEDRTLVALFQAQEGLKPTGFYGPAVAIRLAQTYGIVPPKPLHWTESRTSKSKANYRDALRVFAERDPQRAEEWARAAEV